jgi:hypothetical protein
MARRRRYGWPGSCGVPERTLSTIDDTETGDRFGRGLGIDYPRTIPRAQARTLVGSNGSRERVEMSTSHRDESAVMPRNWAALTGTWSFDDARTVYTGPMEPTTVPYGLAISDLRLRDGRLRT